MAKMRGKTKFILVLIGIWLVMGLYYHFTQDANGDLIRDLLSGGWMLIKGWLNLSI